MELDKLTTTELIETYTQIMTLLKERKVIRTKNLPGIGIRYHMSGITFYSVLQNYSVTGNFNWRLIIKLMSINKYEFFHEELIQIFVTS